MTTPPTPPTPPAPTPPTPIPAAFDAPTQPTNGTQGSYHYVPYVSDGPIATQLSETLGDVGSAMGGFVDAVLQAGEFMETGTIDVPNYVGPGFSDVFEAVGKAEGYGIGWVLDNVNQLGQNMQSFISGPASESDAGEAGLP